MKMTQACGGYTLGYCYSPSLSSALMKWLQQIIAYLLNCSPKVIPGLVEMNTKKTTAQTRFLIRGEKKKETYGSSHGDISVPPSPTTSVSNPPKTYTLSSCKQLLMWCWDPQSREPGSGSFSRGYLEHTKGVLFVAPPLQLAPYQLLFSMWVWLYHGGGEWWLLPTPLFLHRLV